MRAVSPTAAVRAGVEGSWSATNSPKAPTVKMPTAHAEPMKAKGEPWRLIHPRCAAQATTAGAVMDRKPVTTPIPNTSNSPNPEFMTLPSSVTVPPVRHAATFYPNQQNRDPNNREEATKGEVPEVAPRHFWAGGPVYCGTCCS